MSSFWWKRLLFLLFFFSLIALQSCSKKDVKASDEDLVRIKEIYSTIDMIREKYEEKDLQAFLAIIEPQADDLSNNLKKGIETDFANYDKIHLRFRIDEIIMDKDLSIVKLHWDGEWEQRSDKGRFRETGNASLKIKGEKKTKLLSIDGDNPFGISL
ncbi:MAG TPA: hypothetical protein VI584_06400, partial [Nitrospiria bacterium]|nr:hypothetical protein [Nitrospiria bacterium]